MFCAIVAIGRYIRLIWDIAVGMYILIYLWLTVGELRLLDVLVTLGGCAPRWHLVVTCGVRESGRGFSANRRGYVNVFMGNVIVR